jgi:signal transduction histidine kinase/HAMP domain-containing protein
MKDAPTIRGAQVTDANGRTLVSSDPLAHDLFLLSPMERKHLRQRSSETFQVANSPNGDTREGVAPIFVGKDLAGFAWVSADSTGDREQIALLLRITFVYGISAIVASIFVAVVLAQSITRPLAVLREGTRQLIRNPAANHRFPLPVLSSNEASDLTAAFNQMVSSMDEQRAGLTDTLALLDSMLANAPTGFGFFDRKCRYVRINQFLADLNDLSISRHLGKSPTELFPMAAAMQFEEHIRYVFETGESLQDVEVSGELPTQPGVEHHWLINLYPVRTGTQPVRWVGAIIVETTQRIRSEEALRKTEKLAAAGRLAASIAHEINNPLEAVTNLLYLLDLNDSLDVAAKRYTAMAQHELSRVSEITQQTLRFYRQSTLPLFTSVPDLIDSIIALHQGRMNGLNISVQREYRGGGELFCFAGEMRQLFANLVGNAVDAMPLGGRLCVAVRRSCSWRDSSVQGFRIFFADTGSGMDANVRNHIFEPFFTTKEVTGTGLGLWVSAEIIKKHDGIVRVRSRVAAEGKSSGTVFMLFFPERSGIEQFQETTANAQIQ